MILGVGQLQSALGADNLRYAAEHYVLVMLNSDVLIRDSRKSQQKMVKNVANFCENRKNHGKDTALSHGPEDHYTVYKTQHLVLTTIITCSARFSSVKFCRHGHILSQ